MKDSSTFLKARVGSGARVAHVPPSRGGALAPRRNCLLLAGIRLTPWLDCAHPIHYRSPPPCLPQKHWRGFPAVVPQHIICPFFQTIQPGGKGRQSWAGLGKALSARAGDSRVPAARGEALSENFLDSRLYAPPTGAWGRVIHERTSSVKRVRKAAGWDSS